MIARNVAAVDLFEALRVANRRYNGNIVWKTRPEAKGRGYSFTLTVLSSKAPGARRSPSRRRIAAACWHAHRDFMDALFLACPNATLSSALATYKGRYNFRRLFEATGDRDIGSMMNPCRLRNACDCGADLEKRIEEEGSWDGV